MFDNVGKIQWPDQVLSFLIFVVVCGLLENIDRFEIRKERDGILQNQGSVSPE
jgi:hypothetical protein